MQIYLKENTKKHAQQHKTKSKWNRRMGEQIGLTPWNFHEMFWQPGPMEWGIMIIFGEVPLKHSHLAEVGGFLVTLKDHPVGVLGFWMFDLFKICGIATFHKARIQPPVG